MAPVEYGKKTIPELQELLKARSLSHTGRKAELVSRLQEDDKAKAKEAAAAATSTAKADASAEDVIDWDDEAPVAEEDTVTKASTTAGGKGKVTNPVAVPNQKLGENPTTTHDLKVVSKGSVPAAAVAADITEKDTSKSAADYSIGLAKSELEKELKKQKARAERFGIVEESKKALEEKEKALKRAQRFGTGNAEDAGSSAPTTMKSLDQALPQDRPRKRGRGDDDGGRGGKKPSVLRRDRRSRPNMRIPKGGNEVGNTSQVSFSDKDSLANEARKKRFATATS